MSVQWMCMILVLFTITQRLSLGLLSENIPVCHDSTNTTESCCPCYQETMINCTVTCPDEYLSINVSASSLTCKTSPASTLSVTTTTTASVSMATENSTLTSENVTQSMFSSAEEYVIVCQKSCEEHQWYNNETKQCLKCDEKCLKCNPVDGDICTVCYYLYNETCLANCPPGMVEASNKTEDGSKLCELKKPGEKDEKTNLAIIIGGAAGGGAVIIIVIIVIVCCCCRRHRDQQNIGSDPGKRKAMSVLLEQQQGTNESGTNKKPGSRPPGYENMSQTLPTPTDIERQGDNVLRYTQDPTSKTKSEKDEEDTESPYGNVAMIRLAEKVDLTHKESEDVKEMLTIEEMGDAPKAPTPLPVSSGRKKRKGIVKSLSQRVSKRFGRNKEKSLPKPEAHVPEDYLDMSGRQDTSAAVNESTTTDIDTGPTSGLEDYENVDYQRIPQGRQARKVTDHKTSPEDELELYENATGAQPDKTKGDDSDLEDYENTKELRITGNKRPKGSEKPKEDDNENLEDYENMKELELYENTQFGK